jgi:ribosomal protein S18 acetylase RimI-like enzyme
MKEELQNPMETVVIYKHEDFTQEFLSKVVPILADIESHNFPKDPYKPEDFWDVMTHPKSTTAILQAKDSSIIGFALVLPANFVYSLSDEFKDRDSTSEVAYLLNIGIHPDFQGKKLVGVLLKTVDEALRSEGYRYLDRDTVTANGYAQKIKKNYQEKIVKEEGPYTVDPNTGEQIYFRIKL